jgi:hypothetical protein
LPIANPLAQRRYLENARWQRVFPGAIKKKARALPPGLEGLGEDA